MPAAPSSAHTGARHERVDPRVSATRARVLAAVGELLEHGGVTDVTHASVARVAGVGRATVYRHWPTLDSLLVDAVEERLGVIHLVLSGDPLTDLRTMLVTLSAAVLDDTGGALFAALLSTSDVTPQLLALRAEIMERRIGAIEALVRRGIAEGQIDPTLDPAHAVSYLFGPLLHRRIVLGRGIDPAFVDDLLARITAHP